MAKLSIPDLPSEQISAICTFVREHGVCSAHYVGNADRGLIEGLSGMLGKDAVSLMDMADRWKTGFAFWWDEREFPNTPCPERPEWLEGISFYQEGAPDHQIGIRDWPWDSSDQLDLMVKFTGRQPSRILILFGDALMNSVGVEGVSESGKWERQTILRPMPFKHPSYEWEQNGNIWIGRWRDEVISAYERKQRARKRKSSQVNADL